MFTIKTFGILCCLIAVTTVYSSDHIVGGITPLSGSKLKEAEDELKTSLTKLAAGDGPNYKISKLNSASSQVVSGTLYRYNVDLTDEKGDVVKCNVNIWSQPWLENGIEVTFKCDGQEELVKKHSA